MKISANAPCPCHSGEKYKKCCHPYHRGILPANALKLMRSRYSAYALGQSGYIIETTHSDNSDYTDDRERWEKDILDFCKNTRFVGLKIVEFVDGEDEAYVRFEAMFDRGSLTEKSRFLKQAGKWLYESGEFIDTDPC